ncbi:MAG: PrsW family intramembrane metalloprotease [Halobacteriales archaeon]
MPLIPRPRRPLDVVLVAAAAALVLAYVGTGVFTVLDPVLLVLTLPTLVPAAIVTVYIRVSNPRRGWNPRYEATTVALGALAAGVAYTVNNLTIEGAIGTPVLGGMTLFFVVVVAPVEESLKLLAVRLNAYASRGLTTPLDGMYYGALSALGFVTMENALYMLTGGILGSLGVIETAASRANVGILHVFWTSIAAYYLARGRRHRGIVDVSLGLGIAVALHAGYNTYVWHQPSLIAWLGERTAVETPRLETATTFGFLALLYVVLWVFVEYLIDSELSLRRPRKPEPAIKVTVE